MESPGCQETKNNLEKYPQLLHAFGEDITATLPQSHGRCSLHFGTVSPEHFTTHPR